MLFEPPLGIRHDAITGEGRDESETVSVLSEFADNGVQGVKQVHSATKHVSLTHLRSMRLVIMGMRVSFIQKVY